MFDAAVAMTTDTDSNRWRFMRQHQKLVTEKERLKFAREKLEKKCAEAINRHELAKMQAEDARQRKEAKVEAHAAARAAARARREEGIALVRTGEEQNAAWLAARQREKEKADQAAAGGGEWPLPRWGGCGGGTAMRFNKTPVPRPASNR